MRNTHSLRRALDLLDAMTAAIADSTHRADWLNDHRWFAVALLHVTQAVALFWIAAHAAFCCDADYYLGAGRMLMHDGLLWADPHAGYRFFFTPWLFGALESVIDHLFGDEQTRSLVPYALSILFIGFSALASTIVMRSVGFRRWVMFAVPIFLNPLAVSIVPYPLQESVVCIFACPLLFSLLALDRLNFPVQCALGALLVGFTFLARSSLLWMALPIAFLLLTRARNIRLGWLTTVRGGLLAACIVVLMYTPQAYINWNKFHTVAPIPNSEVGIGQVVFGIDMLNYGTVYNGSDFAGLPSHSPYTVLPHDEKTLSFYTTHPKAGLILVLAHAWSSLHFIAFAPYMPLANVDVFTAPLVISSAIVACGLLGLFEWLRVRERRELALFVLLTVVLSCAYTAIAATENRFGIFGFIALSVAAWQVLITRDTRKIAMRMAPLLLAYVGLCVLINALLMYRTGVLWPQPG